MIIACPACATRYVVPDTAIGIEGRTVRCAKCRHSWFQEGAEIAPPESAPPAAPQADGPPSVPAAAQPTKPLAEASPAPGPEVFAAPPTTVHEGAEDAAPAPEPPTAEPPAPLASAPLAEWAHEPAVIEEPADDTDVSQFDREPPFRPRRNWLRWLTWGAGAFAALALAAVVAMSTLGMPSWLPVEKPLFGTDPGLKVEFPASEQERRTLPNGAEFFGARVVITNPTRETKSVPPLLIVLRDSRERVVYSWELAPPQRTLAPGEAMTINEAMTDVPRSAVFADIGWAPR